MASFHENRYTALREMVVGGKAPPPSPRPHPDTQLKKTIRQLPSNSPALRSLPGKSEKAAHPEVMVMTEFVEKYSKQLPVQIKVFRGYCGPSSRLTVSTNDLLNIHLMKRTKVVRIRDAEGTVYSVPVNSSVEFGLVYDPTNSRGGDKGVAGFKLRVPDMLVLDNPPKVVCCMKAWRDEGGDLCLEDNEIVIIKEVVLFSREKTRSKSKKFKGLKVLKTSIKRRGDSF